MKRAFTLVELMIVVAILGILAAIVLPEFTTQTQQAKEATAKDNLRIFRNVIEIYAVRHNGIPPGYKDNDTSNAPLSAYVRNQLLVVDKLLPVIPENPFTGRCGIKPVAGNAPLLAPDQPETYDWLYQPETKTVKLNATGQDSSGIDYFDY